MIIYLQLHSQENLSYSLVYKYLAIFSSFIHNLFNFIASLNQIFIASVGLSQGFLMILLLEG